MHHYAMSRHDILARLIEALHQQPAVVIEFAGTNLSGSMHTPPRPLIEWYIIENGTWEFRTRGLTLTVASGDVVVANSHFSITAEPLNDEAASYAVSP